MDNMEKLTSMFEEFLTLYKFVNKKAIADMLNAELQKSQLIEIYTLRSNLSIYLQYENFCESRCGSGNSDIIIPSQKTIIETKLWNGVEYYNSGIPELREYLTRQQYTQGFYIVYDYNTAINNIIKTNGEFFEINDPKLKMYTIFIRMNPTRPSRIYKNNKVISCNTFTP